MTEQMSNTYFEVKIDKWMIPPIQWMNKWMVWTVQMNRWMRARKGEMDGWTNGYG